MLEILDKNIKKVIYNYINILRNVEKCLTCRDMKYIKTGDKNYNTCKKNILIHINSD